MLATSDIRMELDVKKEGFLWLSGHTYEGWQAFFNGREVELHDGPEAHVKSVYLPEGKGELLLKYRDAGSQRVVVFVGLVCALVIVYFSLLYNYLQQLIAAI